MKKFRHFPHRLLILQLFSIAAALLILAKLFILQVIGHDYYFAIAQKEHYGYTELPARRGNIMVEDKNNGETFKLAANATFYTIYADPTLIKEKEKVAATLAPLLYDSEDEKRFDEIRIKQQTADAKTEEDRQKIRALNEEELKSAFKNRLLEKISQEIRLQILLYEDLNEEVLKIIEKAEFPGIFIKNNNLYAVPQEIESDGKRPKIAEFLSEYIDISTENLDKILRGRNRYTILKQKVRPEIVEKIKSIVNEDQKNFRGIGFEEKYYRMYPENELAAQLLGFVDGQGNGQYGVESSFNAKLKGQNGIFSSQTDVHGNQLTVGESVIRPAVDGDDIYLTIDRAVQLAVERKLKESVEQNRADSGQVIVMDPKTFRIIAMAFYPTFNPNEFGKIFEKKEINLSDDEKKRLVALNDNEDPKHFLLYIDRDKNDKLEIFKEENENGQIVYKTFKNRVGPFVYRNRSVSDIYEPGSVFKIITIASALNDNDVTPETTFYESGPIEVDCHPDKLSGERVCDYVIGNAQDKYRGRLNITQVMQYSSNIGISFIAKKLGRNLLYSYIQNFGFSEKTDIELEEENRGILEYFEKWSESELITHGFGQGVAVTPIQMLSAVSAIANGGVLMQPHIVDKVVSENGKTNQTEPKAIRQVIKKETADIITYMMTTTVEKGIAPQAKLDTHFIAGKSGTTQTYKRGKALKGVGTTIASFAGFGPIDDPKFAILIVIDRPRTDVWGSTSAAPLFREIAEFLYNYYNIPPDKK